MNKTTGIIIGIVIVAIIAGVAYASVQKDDAMTKMDESLTSEDKKAMTEGDNADLMDKGEVTLKSGSYEAYAPEKLARAETGDVVLFFHASWCPSCRGLNADIEQNLGVIPPGVSILKVDYDTESELKKKYGVTYQHTLVQVAADGTLIKKWSGSPTLSTLVTEIN